MTVALGPYLELALEEAPNCEGADNTVSTYRTFPPAEDITDDENMTVLEEKNLVRGFLAPMPHLGAAMFEPKWKIGKVHPRPSHLGFMLAWMLGSWTSTPGDGDAVMDPDDVAVPIGAYKHVFEFRFALEPQTTQARACTGNGEHRLATGIALSKLGFAWENGALVVEPDGLALLTQPVSAPDPAVAPVIDLAHPFRRGDLTIDWLAGSAYTRAFDFAFNAPIEQIWSPVHSSLSPTDIWYKNGELPFISGTIDKATVEDADWQALAQGNQFAATIKIVHREPIGETDYVPTFWCVMPGCELTKNAKQAIKAERRRETKYDWESRYDHVTGKLATVTLVNETPAYAVYGG
jgi:hypothetical protein